MKNKNNRYLFVCFANLHRSLIGEEVFSEMLKQQDYVVDKYESSMPADFYVGSAGVFVEEGRNQFNSSMLERTVNVFIADDLIEWLLKRDFSVEKDERFVNLKIPDAYDTRDYFQKKALEKVLKEKLIPYLPEKKS